MEVLQKIRVARLTGVPLTEVGELPADEFGTYLDLITTLDQVNAARGRTNLPRLEL